MMFPGGLLLSLIFHSFTAGATDSQAAAEGDIRLVNEGNSNCFGRVEIFLNGVWGTVCDDSWDTKDAKVVCRQMKCGEALSAQKFAHFGWGTGQIWLDEVDCLGNETSLSECGHGGTGNHNCYHFEDAAVVCADNTSSGVDGELRLVNGGNNCSGRVEIFRHGHWGIVCDDFWGINDAEVVCTQMKCGRAVSALRYAFFEEGTGPILLDDVHCRGNETSLSECGHIGNEEHNCRHYEAAGVICEAQQDDTSSVEEGTVRLVNDGDSSCFGRVEIFLHGHWGTVCDDFWDTKDAEVVCRQMECGKAVSAQYYTIFGGGIGPIWLDDVHCVGNETNLSECGHRGYGIHNCGHYEDAGVICEDDTSSVEEGTVRLVDGANNCSGRVEIFLHGHWGTVCDDYFDLNAAEVVCTQMECGRAVSAQNHATFGEGTGPIWLDDVWCWGSETNLSECGHRGYGIHNCGHYEDAGVICEAQQDDTSSVKEGTVRLVDGANNCSGRVEIFLHGYWGTVCDDHWDLNAAEVVCRQISCGEPNSATASTRYGEGTGPIWLDNVSCGGSENSLTECGHQGIGSHNCHHYEDVNLVCADN